MKIKLPPGIGPHEGRECALMLDGTKPLAMFCDALSHSGHFPEEEFSSHVLAGRITRREELYLHTDGILITRCLFFALPDQEWRMETAHNIQKAIYTGSRRSTEADDTQLGLLLGYTNEEITAFLEHARRYLHLRKQL